MIERSQQGNSHSDDRGQPEATFYTEALTKTIEGYAQRHGIVPTTNVFWGRILKAAQDLASIIAGRDQAAYMILGPARGFVTCTILSDAAVRFGSVPAKLLCHSSTAYRITFDTADRRRIHVESMRIEDIEGLRVEEEQMPDAADDQDDALSDGEERGTMV